MPFLAVHMVHSFTLAHTIYLVYQLTVFVNYNARMLNSLISSPSWKQMHFHLTTKELARSYFMAITFIWMTMVCCFPFGRPVNTQHDVCSQLVIPDALKHEVLVWAHDDVTAGHLGTQKTYGNIRTHYYWRNMFWDIDRWCKSCVDCAMKKLPRNRHKAPLLPIPVENAFDHLAVDCLGPFPLSNAGNHCVVVFTEHLTRWPEAFAVPNTDTPTIACLLVNHIILPQTLLSDRGTNFLSLLVRSVCELLNTKKVNTTAYHPQTDGLVERFNHTLCQSVSMYVSRDQKDWDTHLPAILFGF